MFKIKVPADLLSAESSLPCLADGYLLTVSSHGLFSVCTQGRASSLMSLIRTLILLDKSATIMTSFNLN